ncbi:MAG TPA: serine hydrolase domain-containing protein, partial [bacterium]|nr:serine hydrolase domain-containing protein [bacterium]
MVIDKFGRQKPGCRAATLAAILFFVLSAHAAAQLVQPAVEDLRKLDQWVQQYMQDNTVPGALVAVASKGKLVHLQTYGWANVELQVPVTDSTVFEIGSISKQFVAAAVLLLVQEHKLDLDDPIGQHLPWLPSEWLGVTVRQLLTHTSGIPDYEEIRSYDVYRFR